jgi:hypothetical protein
MNANNAPKKMDLFIDGPRARDQFETLPSFAATAQGVQTRMRERVVLLPGVAPTAANGGKRRKFWPTVVV